MEKDENEKDFFLKKQKLISAPNISLEYCRKDFCLF